MKKVAASLFFILGLSCIVFVVNTSAGNNAGRKATLFDDTNDKTEIQITGVEPFYQIKYVKSPLQKSFYVFTSTLDYCVPIDAVVSIERTSKILQPRKEYERKAKIYKIKYVLDGKPYEIDGAFESSQVGSSRNKLLATFGSSNAEIDMCNISKLSFSNDPQKLESFQSHAVSDSFEITFTDNTKVKAKDIFFHQENYSTDGYWVGGEYVQNFYSFLPLQKGALNIEVKFSEIQSIILIPVENEISPDWYYEFDSELRLRDGSIVKGKLSKIYEFSGFTGVTENGPFFVQVRNIKRIDLIVENSISHIQNGEEK